MYFAFQYVMHGYTKCLDIGGAVYSLISVKIAVANIN